MTTDAERVAAKAEAMFGSGAEEVMARLAVMETPGSIGADRISLAILKLSAGDTARLDDLIELAKIDPRDVIGDAEYPRQMRHPPGMATEDMILADRADYEAWLEGEPPP